jgi:hypothetical protein
MSRWRAQRAKAFAQVGDCRSLEIALDKGRQLLEESPNKDLVTQRSSWCRRDVCYEFSHMLFFRKDVKAP